MVWLLVLLRGPVLLSCFVSAQERCGPQPVPPTVGTFERAQQARQLGHKEHVKASDKRHQQEHQDENPVRWRFNTKAAGCSYSLWNQTELSGCLKGSWVILAGASHTILFTVMLANLLDMGALLLHRDHFSANGIWTQLVDIVLAVDNSTSDYRYRVVYKNIVVEPNTAGKAGYAKFKTGHSAKRDARILKRVFKQASSGRTEERKTGWLEGSYTTDGLPEYDGTQIRITLFVAEYWDVVPMALFAVRAAKLGWDTAPVAAVIFVGPWYCNPISRPEYFKLNFTGRAAQFRTDLEKSLPSIRSFCSRNGPAADRGCAMLSLAHCPRMTGKIYGLLRNAAKEAMIRTATPILRFIDLWTLTMELPEACLGGHPSPMSMLWTWQVLLGGFCAHAAQQPVLGTLAEFEGPRCTADQVIHERICHDRSHWKTFFECALAKPCTLVIHPDPEANSTPEVADTMEVMVDLTIGTTLKAEQANTTLKAEQANTTFKAGQAVLVAEQTVLVATEEVVANRALLDRIILACMAVLIAVFSHVAEQHLTCRRTTGADQRQLAAASPSYKPIVETLEEVQDDDSGNPSTNLSKKPPTGDRFAFGLARYIASLHVVTGHLHAQSAIADVSAFGWGFSWVPWFFMLSGFILFSAEHERPKAEAPSDYILRRSINIYPLYAVALVISLLIAKSQGHSPSYVVLVLQAWLMQAWPPQYTEHTLNMQCWFLSCLVVYWGLFQALYGVVSGMKLGIVLSTMLALFLLPWLIVVVPLWAELDMNWYHSHVFGHAEDTLDLLVVFLKFNPLVYLHVFVIGMLLGRLRCLLGGIWGAPNCIEAFAPVGYVGLLLIFCIPQVRLPASKLSARLSVLLPLQSMILLGLAGLQGLTAPFFAHMVSPLNFIESYAYGIYVNQFICWHLWRTKRAGVLFFIFLAGVSAASVHLVQRPVEALLRQSNKPVLMLVPLGVTILLVVLNWLCPDSAASSSAQAGLPTGLPGYTRFDESMVDTHFPIHADWLGQSVLINPSIAFGPHEVVLVARAHRRSHKQTQDDCYYTGKVATCINEIWHSDIVVTSVPFEVLDLHSWMKNGTRPHIPKLKRWSGLSSRGGLRAWTDLCVREHYISENRTLMKLVVTGPEDPKVFQLAKDEKGGSDVVFVSYPPKDWREGCPKDGRSWPQMYLAQGLVPSMPDKRATGHWLNCGSAERPEKNWIPFEWRGQLHFVYSVSPHAVMKVNYDNETGVPVGCGDHVVSSHMPLVRLQMRHPDFVISGSGQAVFVNHPNSTPHLPRPHFLALFHVKRPSTQQYGHFAYRFSDSPPFQMLQVSAQLPLRTLASKDGGRAAFAFASGLALRDGIVVVTYSAGDRESRMILFTLERLDALFDPENASNISW